jgi:SAM-dependent methyltransferase
VKIRESGMPEEALWESLFDVDLVLFLLGIDRSMADVTELGCGYGTFTLPVAQKISGTLRTFDIEKDMVARTQRRAAEAGLQNVVVERRDVIQSGFGVAPGSQDGCLLFNILHCDEPIAMLHEARQCVRPGGRILALHWRSDVPTPRGPSPAIRPRPDQIASWAARCELQPAGEAIVLPPWHFGLVLRVPAAEPTERA